MTVVLEPDALARDGIRDAVGGDAASANSFDELTVLMRNDPEISTVILGPSVDGDTAMDFAERTRASNPTLGVVLVRRRIDAVLLAQALRAGVREVVSERDLPGSAEAVSRSRPSRMPCVTPTRRQATPRLRPRPPLHGVLPQGRCREDHLLGQRRRSAWPPAATAPS